MVCKIPHLRVNHSSAILVASFQVLAFVLNCACMDKPPLLRPTRVARVLVTNGAMV
jgi:hypothetical protein